MRRVKILSIIAVLAALGGVMVGADRRTYAAQISDVKTNVEIQIHDNPNSTAPTGVNPPISKFNLKFEIDDEVFPDDYFTFETHALPEMASQDIVMEGKVVGRLQKDNDNIIAGSRKYQDGKTVDVSDLRPEDNYRYKYTVTFNDVAKSFHSIVFNLTNTKRTVQLSIANKQYTTRAWVRVNDVEVASKSYDVAAWSKTKYTTDLTHSTTRFDLNRNEILLTIGVRLQEILGEDGEIEVSLPDNSPLKFIKQSDKTRELSNFVYDESTPVNRHGLIISGAQDAYLPKLKNLDESKISFIVAEQASPKIVSSLRGINIGLSDAGKKYFIENSGKLPQVEYILKIKKGGKEILSKTVSANVSISGNTADFISKINEKLVEDSGDTNTKIEVEAYPSGTELTIEEVKAPNTGFTKDRGTISAIALAITGVVLLFHVVYLLKNKA
ncbi:MAG: hypothetical protein Q4A21_02670 [bacterium]|nr:hypothetical protein [bacterium]